MLRVSWKHNFFCYFRTQAYLKFPIIAPYDWHIKPFAMLNWLLFITYLKIYE